MNIFGIKKKQSENYDFMTTLAFRYCIIGANVMKYEEANTQLM